MSKRALIIGTDRDYCFIIKEFLALRELYVTVVLNYKEGIDKLLYEKPDLTVLELTARASAEDRIDEIAKSHEFEIVDFCGSRELKEGTRAVLIFDDKSRINALFDFLKCNYSSREPEQPQDTEDGGSLSRVFYPSLLVDIRRNRMSGILSVTSSTELIIYFTNGEPVFAEGGDIETAIGRILQERGKIDEKTYKKALDAATKNKQKFGQILFEMGITSPHELNSFLEFQIEEKILRGFNYISGRYEFKRGDEFVDRIVPYQVNLSKIIYEGVKRYIDVDILEEQNPVIEIGTELKSDINNLGLKPKELRFVQLLKERSTVKEVLETSRLEKTETLKLLYFLSLLKLINLSGISPDAIGRESVGKRIEEKEAEGGETPEAEMSEEDRGAETGAVEEEDMEPTQTVSGAVTPESDTWEVLFDLSQTQDETAAENEHHAPEGTGDDAAFGEPDEVKTARALKEDAPGFEAELDSGNDFDDTDSETAHEDARESSPHADEGYSSRSGDLKAELELELDKDAEYRQMSGDYMESGNVNDLLRPYAHKAGGGETESGGMDEGEGFELLSTHRPSGPTLGDDTPYYSPEKTFSPVFEERVSEFHAELDHKDYYQLLGVSRDASAEKIRDAYYKLVKFYHPDAKPNADLAVKAKAQEIFTRITDAYETLSEADKRQQYDSHEEYAELKTQAKYIYEAEVIFKKGITLLIQRDYVEAEKKIREALEMNPNEAAYLGAHAWTRFLAAEDKSAVLEEAIKSLEKAVKMNAKIPENYYYFGSIYKFTNDLKNAEKYYRKALEQAPDYIEAKREIRLINTRNTESRNEKKTEKGFWSSIFKKH